PLQGDSVFIEVLEEMGAIAVGSSVGIVGPGFLKPIDSSMHSMPDTAMTAAVLACFASPTAANPTGTSTLRGLRTLRVKETDRLEALRVELAKIGAVVEIFRD